MQTITSKQLMVFILASQIGVGILLLPSQLAKTTGHDGWIPVLLSGILSSVLIIFIMLLLERYGDKSILEINKLLYGRILGVFLNIILALYLLYGTIIITRIYGEIIKLSILRTTPPIVLAIFSLVPTVYLVWYGLKPAIRFSHVLFFILPVVVLLCALLYRNMRISFILPVGEAGYTGIMKGMFPSVFSYIGFEAAAFVYPRVTDKEKALRYVLLANLTSMVFFLLVVISATMLFGEDMLKMINIPLFNMARVYRAPIIERVDLFLMILWFPALASSLRIFFLLSYDSMNRIFNIKHKLAFLYILFGAIVLLSRIPKDFIDTYKYGNYFSYAGMAIIGLITFNYFLSFLNRKGVKKK